MIWAYTQAIDTGLEVTLDVDAQLVETSKSEAKYCYDGYKVFQPIEVEWAEVPYVPSRKQADKEARPYRYVSIRIWPGSKWRCLKMGAGRATLR